MDINNLSPDQLSDFLKEYGVEIERMNCRGISGRKKQREMWNWIPDRYRDIQYPIYQACKKSRLQKSLRYQIEKHKGLKEKSSGQAPQDGWQKYPRGEGDLTGVERRLYAAIHQKYREVMLVEEWKNDVEEKRQVVENEFKEEEEKHGAGNEKIGWYPQLSPGEY